MSDSEARLEFVAQLGEEFLERLRRGEWPSLEEYVRKYPDYANEIREIFRALAVMEKLAPDKPEPAAGAAKARDTKAPTLTQIGDFRIIRLVGKGGMGVVYEAEQLSLGRRVAVKVLPQQMLPDAKQKRRFEREAKAAGKLHHTNIVPVFGIGEENGLHYYVMQFIQGLGLEQVLIELKRIHARSIVGQLPSSEVEISRPDSKPEAAAMARSLFTGQFLAATPVAAGADEEPALAAPRLEAAALGLPVTEGVVSDQPLEAQGKRADPIATVHSPVVPVKGAGDRAAATSGSFSASSVTLPGQLSASTTSSRAKRQQTYWHSVARIGVQVAQALQYAHEQGVLHRDIKPSNLLLDMRGTVWVTDFGLAKASGHEDITHTGDILGTLRYMPPEAFEGRSDARADIYSLGLTLYEMLTFEPAFGERDRNKLIKKVTTESAPRLDRLNPKIPRDLVTVVHKAIEREPLHRYATASELADDLQRFVDDEPIKARRVGWHERWGRWCRHNPVIAGLSAVLLLLLLSVSIASSLAARHFNVLAAQEAQAADKEREARQVADEAKEHEAGLRAQAQTERRQAEANFAKARQAVDDYFTKVSESQLLQVPGMQPLRRELLQSALAFYQDFLKERGDDPTIRAELAAAFLRAGTIHAELGDKDQERNAFEQARGLYQALTNAAPESVEWQHGLALAYFRLNRNDDAIALWEKLVQPGQARFQKELAEAYNTRAKDHYSAGRNAQAMEAHQKALAIREMLAGLNPDDPAIRFGLGQTLNNIGALLDRQGRYADGLAMERRAAENGEVAFGRAPQMIFYGRGLTIFYRNVAIGEGRSAERTAEAISAYRRVVDIWKKLARDNPAVVGLHSALMGAYRDLAAFQRERKQIQEADRTMRLAREVIERLPSEGPDDLFNVACVRAECAGFIGQGKAELTVEEQAEQKQETDLAVDALQRSVALGFRNLARLRDAPELKALRGREDFKNLEADLSARVAAVPEKLRAGQDALALRRQLAAADPGNKRLQADLAASQHAVGALQLGFGKTDEALKSFSEALAMRERLVQEEPGNTSYAADLRATWFALGDLHWRSGRLRAAMTFWQKFLDQEDAAVRGDPENVSLKNGLAESEAQIAESFASLGLWGEAATYFARAFDHGAPAHPNHGRSHRYNVRALLLLLAGDKPEYERLCNTMMNVFGPKVSSPDPWAVAYVGALTPNAVQGKDWTTLIDNTVAAGRYVAPSDRFVVDLARYRNGQWKEALAGLRETELFNGAKCWLVFAMIHHQLEHPKEARRWLEKAEKWYEQASLDILNEGPLKYPSSPWWEWTQLQILRREATALIEGKPAADSAYLRLHYGRAYAWLGDMKKAEAHFQAAVGARPEDPAIWLARARVLSQLGMHDRAEADFAKALSLKAGDARPLIERGRWYAERGLDYKANDDFAAAAKHCPNDLNRFLESGWWVVGPYPRDLNRSCSPEKEPDPSRPVTAVGDETKLHWRFASTGSFGRVDLGGFFNSDFMSVYALNYIWAPEERTATLVIGGDDDAKVWLNGQVVLKATPLYHPQVRDPGDFLRVPVTLRAGRNIVLTRVAPIQQPHYLHVVLADNPLVGRIDLLRVGLFQEAASWCDRLTTGYFEDRGVDGRHPPHYFLHAYACLRSGDFAGYQRVCRRTLDRPDRRPGDWAVHYWGTWAASTCALGDDAVTDPTEPLRAAEKAVASSLKDYGTIQTLAAAHLRAGHLDEAIRCAEESIHGSPEASSCRVGNWLILALALQRKGQTEKARVWRDKAEEWFAELTDAQAEREVRQGSWSRWFLAQALRAEADRLIAGTTEDREKPGADRFRDQLKKLDKATFDYDVALMLQPNEPRLWLAHSRRYQELKPDQEADAVFAKALELINDGGALLTLGQRHAQRREWRRAFTCYARAGRSPAEQSGGVGFEQACLSLLTDDKAGYQRTLDRLLEPPANVLRRLVARACTLSPDAAKQIPRAVELSAAELNEKDWFYLLTVRAALKHRAGRYEEAAKLFQQCLDQNPTWDGNVLNWLWLALTCERLGQNQEARQWLERADRWLAKYPESMPTSPEGTIGLQLHDWLEAHVLLREAKTLIEGKSRSR